ncbi:hypothetical protein Tco_0589428 [Tanacetum coccineum]
MFVETFGTIPAWAIPPSSQPPQNDSKGLLDQWTHPHKTIKWSAGSVDPLYNAMLVGMLYSGPENSIILRVKGVFNASLKGLLKSSSSISFPFTMRSSLGSWSSISKFSRIGLALFRLL